MTMPYAFSDFDTLPDLWQTLAHQTRDIYLYGMGDGADKILAVMQEKRIPCAGVFASDGFVRGQVFHGMRVISFGELCARYPANGCIVLLAFGSARAEVLALFDKVAERFPLFVPDVPVCGERLFDHDFFLANKEKFSAARALLCDAESKRIFDLVIAAKLTASYTLLRDAVSPDDEQTLLGLDTVRCAADLGAYVGDTARTLLLHAPIEHLICAEPDARSFRKCAAWAKTVTSAVVECHPVAVCDTDGTALFSASGNRGAELGRGIPTRTMRVDTLLAGKKPDLIKYDVEGAEHTALCGSADTILRARPRLKIACYHRSEDLFDLPLLAATLAPDYRFYLRRRDGVPAWDVDLYAVPTE